MATNPYQSMNGDLGRWVMAEGAGVPGANFPVLARNVKLWSRKNILVGANFQRQLRFFNESPSAFVQDFINNSALPANFAMVIHTIRFGFHYGLSRDGLSLGISSPSSAQKLLASLNLGSSVAAGGDLLATQWKAAESIRRLFATPTVSMQIGSQTDLWTVSGLDAFPDGKGSLVQAGLAASSTSATAAGMATIVQSITNGAPVQSNMWTFTNPWPLAGTETFNLTVDWPQPVDFADADIGPLNGQESTVVAGFMTAEIQGVLAGTAS